MHMLLGRWHHASLKFKIAVAGTIAMLAIIATLSSISLTVMRRDIMNNAAAAQKILIDKVAQDLDHRIAERKEALALTASVLTHKTIPGLKELDDFYTTRPVFVGMFDFVFITDRKGKIIYDIPELPGRRGRSIADRAYFKAIIQTGQPTVSEPVAGKTTNAPNIAFAHPLRDADGAIIGMIGGILLLDKPNFLGQLGRESIGKNGYFALVSKDATPTIIMHKQRDRIMTPAPDAKSDPQFARALEGFEGTVEGTNSLGVAGLHSYRSLKSVPWVIAAIYPADDANALIKERQAQIIGLAILLAVLSGILLWILAGRLMRPLKELGEVMTADMESNGTQPLPTPRTVELANAVKAYATLREHKRHFESALVESEERVRSILAHAGDAFISVDVNGLITEWNRQAEETLGWYRNEVLGKSLAEVIIPEGMRDAHNQGLKRFVVTGQGPTINRRVEVMALHRTGREIPVELSISALKSAQGYVANAFLRDISDRRNAEKKLGESEQRLRDITNNLPVLISYIGQDWRFKFANETYRSWFNIPPENMLGKHVRDVIGPTFERRRESLEKAMRGEYMTFEMEERIHAKDCVVQTTYVPHRSSIGEVCGVYVLSADVSAMKAVERELAVLARIDSLTGLPNRRNFEEKLDEAIARSQRLKKALSLMFIDVDHFKAINDSLGHAGGDLVLKEFAQRLKKSIRKTDMVARLGGDEFVIILEGVKNNNEPRLVAKKIMTAMGDSFYVGDRALTVTTSIGIAFDQEASLSAIELTAKADEALYVTKEAGRNGYQLAVA